MPIWKWVVIILIGNYIISFFLAGIISGILLIIKPYWSKLNKKKIPILWFVIFIVSVCILMCVALQYREGMYLAPKFIRWIYSFSIIIAVGSVIEFGLALKQYEDQL